MCGKKNFLGNYNRPYCTIDLFAYRQELLLQFISETSAASIPADEPAAAAFQIDLQQLSFLVHSGSLRVV